VSPDPLEAAAAVTDARRQLAFVAHRAPPHANLSKFGIHVDWSQISLQDTRAAICGGPSPNVGSLQAVAICPQGRRRDRHRSRRRLCHGRSVGSAALLWLCLCRAGCETSALAA
jgi:hypothetical protein